MFDPRSGQVYVVDKVALEQDFAKYFASPANSHSTNCNIFINHPTTNANRVLFLMALLNNKLNKFRDGSAPPSE
jgi:hypothetical protein